MVTEEQPNGRLVAPFGYTVYPLYLANDKFIAPLMRFAFISATDEHIPRLLKLCKDSSYK